MATTTNYGWDTPDDTDLVKDGAAAIRTLGSSVDTTTKNLNPQTTTGALAYRSATANINTALPIGTANQVLRVNSGGTAPEWATLAGGDFVQVASAAPSAAASISISSCFSATYKAYKIIFVLTASAGTNLLWKGRVSSTDTSINYNYQDFELSNASFFNASYTSQTSGKCGDLQTFLTSNEMTIMDPVATNSTSAFSLSSSGGNNMKMNTSRQTDNTSFDGITFLTGSGTMSGNIYVYGMKA